MPHLYPLRFEPLLRRYPWGGQRLGTKLGKSIGSESCAESWEICDRGQDQSRVLFGPLVGTTLAQIMAHHGAELLGRHEQSIRSQQTSGARFPLLVKFLDAATSLSVQVHPNDQRAARLPSPDMGKTEAWVVLGADPGSKIYAGLKPGCDRSELQAALARNECEACLHAFEPRVGDCVFIPAGLVHALGAGLLVAEIQQSSDVTYRLFDWNRIGPDGKPRLLHVAEALESIRFDLPASGPIIARATAEPGCEELVSCEHFVLRRWKITEQQSIGGDQRFRILLVLGGELTVAGDPGPQPLGVGDTILVPAGWGEVSILPERLPESPATLLEVYLP